MTRASHLAALAAIAVLALHPAAAAPLSKKDLLALVQQGKDTTAIVALVRKDCVDFEIDAATLGELCGQVPPEVLLAAIECRRHLPSPPAAVATIAVPSPVPSLPAAPAPLAVAPPAPSPTAAPALAPVAQAPGPAASDAWLRISSSTLKGGCYLFVDYGGSVARLRQRGTATTMHLGDWETEFHGEQYWWLAMQPSGGASAVASVPAGRRSLTLYCAGGWYRLGTTAELTGGRMNSLLVNSKGSESISIEGLRVEPPGTPAPSERERAFPRTVQ